MPSLPDYDRLDATELAALVRRKEVSPPELVEAAVGDEATLLRLAAQLEQTQPWAGRRPPLS